VADGDEHPDPALGVFDTLLVRDGVPVDLDVHLERLARSVRDLYGVPVDVAALAERLVADVGDLARARVRTSYDPGAGQWEIDAARIDDPGHDPRTLALRRVAGGLGAHKWTDRRLVADPGDADDVLLVDEHDHLLECGSANVFVVLAGRVVTPPLDGRILPGTVRARVLAALRSDGHPLAERAVSVAEVAEATEMFTTSSIRGVQPVAACLCQARGKPWKTFGQRLPRPQDLSLNLLSGHDLRIGATSQSELPGGSPD
jgi:para-aminobenzoate synthetase/4-amino-4-deoxychorismate lyase